MSVPKPTCAPLVCDTCEYEPHDQDTRAEGDRCPMHYFDCVDGKLVAANVPHVARRSVA